MDKDKVLETVDFYMKQVLDLVRRGKTIDPISILDALGYIKEDIRKLPSYDDGYQKAISEAKKIIIQTKMGFKL